MNRINVSSSDVKSVGYEPSSKTLEVEFINKGSVYHYYDIPESLYRGLISDSSVGGYLSRNIKKAGFRYTRVR